MPRKGFEPTIVVLKTANVSHCAAHEISTVLEAARHNPSKHSGNYIYHYVNTKAPNAVSKLPVLIFVRFFVLLKMGIMMHETR